MIKMMRSTMQSDIDKCLSGKCMGAFCPCLCHTSLKYDHAVLAAVNGGRHGKPRTTVRPRPRVREAQAS